MTRLTQGDIARLPELLPAIDKAFRRAAGAGLGDLARWAAEGPAAERQPAGHGGENLLAGLPVGIVPVSAGQGFIPGFPEAVAAVCRFIGCEAFVTEKSDVAGLAAAVERQARLVLLADDERFICLDLRSGRFADNGEATGRGYAAALTGAARHLSSSGQLGRQEADDAEPVLVIGLGPVGLAAALWLRQAGFRVLLHDRDERRAREAAVRVDSAPVVSLEEGLRRADLILDASPAPDLLGADRVTGRTVVAGPGMPAGPTPAAADLLGERFLHEPLALGVATMVHCTTFSRTDPGPRQ